MKVFLAILAGVTIVYCIYFVPLFMMGDDRHCSPTCTEDKVLFSLGYFTIFTAVSGIAGYLARD